MEISDVDSMEEESMPILKNTKKRKRTSKKVSLRKEKKVRQKYVCVFCSVEVASSNIKRHERECYYNPNKEPKSLCCDRCLKFFSRTEQLKQHLAICSTRKLSQIKCMFDECVESFTKRTWFVDHLRTDHGCEIKCPETMQFNSVSEFELWKEREEERSYSYFSKKCGTKNGKSYFYCQQDGSSKPHSKNAEGRKTGRRVRAGLMKQDKVCIAMMHLDVKDDGTCFVKYFPTHSHPIEVDHIRRHPQTKATHNFIDTLISLQLSPREIVKNLKSSRRANTEEGIVPKEKFVTRNLVKLRSYKLKSSLKTVVADANSVHNFDTVLMEETSSDAMERENNKNKIADIENKCKSILELVHTEKSSDDIQNLVCSTIDSLEKQCIALSDPLITNEENIDSKMSSCSKKTKKTEAQQKKAIEKSLESEDTDMVLQFPNETTYFKQELLTVHESQTPLTSDKELTVKQEVEIDGTVMFDHAYVLLESQPQL